MFSPWAITAFVEAEGWEPAGNRGGHVNYLLKASSLAVLYTGISQGAASTEYFDPRMRSVIVHQQLRVTQEEFWACVNRRKRPERRSDGYSVGLRGQEDASPPPQDPALLRELEREFGESPADVEGMTNVELRAYLAPLWDRHAHRYEL